MVNGTERVVPRCGVAGAFAATAGKVKNAGWQPALRVRGEVGRLRRRGDGIQRPRWGARAGTPTAGVAEGLIRPSPTGKGYVNGGDWDRLLRSLPNSLDRNRTAPDGVCVRSFE